MKKNIPGLGLTPIGVACLRSSLESGIEEVEQVFPVGVTFVVVTIFLDLELDL